VLSSTVVVISLHIHVHIHTVSPQITMQPMNDLEQLVGRSVSFTCGTSGIPTPDVAWYFNGMQLTESDVISISGNTLSISPLAEMHTGMYQCFVSNMAGTDQTSWALQVRTPGEGVAHMYQLHLVHHYIQYVSAATNHYTVVRNCMSCN